MERIATILSTGEADVDMRYGARRASQRFPLDAEIELIEPCAARGIAINASTGGMRMAIDRRVEVDALCIARVTTDEGRQSLEKARVVWTRQLPDGWLVGVCFLQDH